MSTTHNSAGVDASPVFKSIDFNAGPTDMTLYDLTDDVMLDTFWRKYKPIRVLTTGPRGDAA